MRMSGSAYTLTNVTAIGLETMHTTSVRASSDADDHRRTVITAPATPSTTRPSRSHASAVEPTGPLVRSLPLTPSSAAYRSSTSRARSKTSETSVRCRSPPATPRRNTSKSSRIQRATCAASAETASTASTVTAGRRRRTHEEVGDGHERRGHADRVEDEGVRQPDERRESRDAGERAESQRRSRRHDAQPHDREHGERELERPGVGAEEDQVPCRGRPQRQHGERGDEPPAQRPRQLAADHEPGGERRAGGDVGDHRRRRSPTGGRRCRPRRARDRGDSERGRGLRRSTPWCARACPRCRAAAARRGRRC